MKRILHTWLLIVLVMAGCAKQECGFLTPINSEDEEYALFLDSLEVLISDYNCYHIEDSVLMPVMAFYEEDSTRRHLWMQARCNYLSGCLLYDQNRMEQSAACIVKTLNLLDTYFDASNASVGRLYSKTFITASRIAHLFSGEHTSEQLARFGLDCATTANDTAWMLRSYANLGLLYERFGKAGEGDTAFLYCREGLCMADAQRFPFETALLENSLANCLRRSNECDSALIYFRQCDTLVDSTYIFHYRNCIEMAFVYYNLQDYASAIAVLERAFRTESRIFKVQAAFGLADCYEKMNDTLKAMPYYAIVKEGQAQQTIRSNQNGEAMAMLNAYLRTKMAPQNGNVWFWRLMVIGILVLAVIIVTAFKRGKKDNVSFAQSWAQYEQSDAFVRIRERLAAYGGKISSKNVDDFPDLALGQADFVALKDATDAAFGDFATHLAKQYPELNPADLNACCLALMGLSHAEMAVLQGVKYNSFTNRISKIKKILGTEENLSDYLKNMLKKD